MMRPSRLGGAGGVLRAAGQVVSGKDSFSLPNATSSPRPATAAADIRAVAAPTPTFAATGAGAVVWTDWESVNHSEAETEAEAVEEEELAEREYWYLDAAPGLDEVEAAICSLQQMSIPSPFAQHTYHLYNDDHEHSHSNSDDVHGQINSLPTTSLSAQPPPDWIEPSFHASARISSPNNSHKALEAFHLLKVNPSIQKMVFSLSSDKAVWEAVMKNEAVQEIKKSLCEGIPDAKASDDRGPVECIVSALGNIYSSTRTTVMELIDKVTTFVSNLVHSSEKKGDDESEFFADAVKSSLMLSVFVFLIVIVGRLQK